MLTQPLKLASGLELPNRLAKASMTESLAPSGDPSDTLCALYRAWGSWGAGLLLSGNVMIDRRYLERLGNVVFDGRTERASVRRWAEETHRGGAALFAQLSHPGRQTNLFVHPRPVAPSAVRAVRVLGAFGKPRALREEELEEVLERFAGAAHLARECGLDGVQLHAAHGYLLSQFLSPATNQRGDRWGGSLAQRAAFPLEVLRRVRARVGPRFGLAMKLNTSDFQRGGFAPEEALEVLSLLENEGLDFVELSGGNYESVALLGRDEQGQRRVNAREAYFLEFAQAARARTRMPLMLTGGLRTRRGIEEALGSGLDLVGAARPFCVHPRVGQHLCSREDAAVRSFHIPELGVRAMEGQAETEWCQVQMRRIARGLEPSLGQGVRALTAGNLLRDMVRGPLRRLRGEAEGPPA